MSRAVSQGRQMENRTYNRGAYVHGSAARAAAPAVREDKRQTKLDNTTRKNREKAKHMNLGYVLFLSAAVVLTGSILMFYINMQSNITNSVKNISHLENQLNELKLSNDEEYSRIVSDVDLEEVKHIAMSELGMIYAKEGQIETFASEESDYVRQLAEIPSAQ